MTRHAYSRKTFNRKYIPWLALLIFCITYLVVDWSLLHADGSGGYIPGIQKDYRTGKAIFLFYPLPDYSNSETRIEVANDWGGTGWWPYEMYVFFPAQDFPLWAPTRIPPPRLVEGSDMTQNPGLYLTPSAEAIQSAIEAAQKLDQADKDYAVSALRAYEEPSQLIWPGVARNTVALLAAVTLLISLARLCWLGTYHIKLTKRLNSGRCQCGYHLAGLSSPTCPECGRTIAATPAQSPTTLDA